jgi:hypothetical protein
MGYKCLAQGLHRLVERSQRCENVGWGKRARDPAFGPDSALYEAMGYVRKSGLTRKGKTA